MIADHKLPDMLAIDLVRALREHPTMKNLPVFVYADEPIKEAEVYSQYAVDGPIAKPDTEDAFRSVVHDAIHRHLSI